MKIERVNVRISSVTLARYANTLTTPLIVIYCSGRSPWLLFRFSCTSLQQWVRRGSGQGFKLRHQLLQAAKKIREQGGCSAN